MAEVFVSYAHVDAEWVDPLIEALEVSGISVWFDRREIDDFTAITARLGEGLAESLVILACYSRTYPTRPACQWELTRALTLALWGDASNDRVLVVVPSDEDGTSSRWSCARPATSLLAPRRPRGPSRRR